MSTKLELVLFFISVLLVHKNQNYATYCFFHCTIPTSTKHTNSIEDILHYSYEQKFNIVYINNIEVSCIISGIYVECRIGRGTPKSGWCGAFTKHCANGAVRGSSGGCVGASALRTVIEDDGSLLCCSHRRVRRKKSSPALYHFGSVAIIARAAATNALRESATVGAKIDQNAARHRIPGILGLMSKAAFGSGAMMLPRRSLYLYTCPFLCTTMKNYLDLPALMCTFRICPTACPIPLINGLSPPSLLAPMKSCTCIRAASLDCSTFGAVYSTQNPYSSNAPVICIFDASMVDLVYMHLKMSNTFNSSLYIDCYYTIAKLQETASSICGKVNYKLCIT